MSKEYKLTNVNSRKKTFPSVKELKDYVTEKDLKPNDMSQSIKYDIITVTTRSIKVDVDKVSDDMATKLFKEMKNRLASGELQGSPDMYSRRFKNMKNHPLLKHFHKILINNGYPKDGFPSNTWYTWKPTIEKSMGEFLDYLIDNHTKFDLTMIKQMTDYRPCHGYGIQLDDHAGYLFLREGGVMFDNWAVYGRNVHSRGQSILTDKDVEKVI
jgi:hypothetical protein